MIDLHSHLLPAIDDGSRSPSQSYEVLLRFAAEGVSDIVLTPHARASELEADPDDPVERRQLAFNMLTECAPDGIPRLHLGFEIMLDEPLAPLATGDRRFSLAQSKYYLVEFPTSVVPHYATGVLQQVARSGVVPLVAHPERYSACTPDAVREWKRAGARIQVDATTLTRDSARGTRARELLRRGLADVLAADNHGDSRGLKTAWDYLVKHGGEIQANWLAIRNPGAVLNDGEMEPVPPIELKRGVMSKLRDLLR